MSDNKVDNPDGSQSLDKSDTNLAVTASEVSSVAGSVNVSQTHTRITSTSDRQIKFERAQKCLENAALVSKRIKEHRKATAELLGRPFEEDEIDTASEIATTMSERTGYSAATEASVTLSVQDALNIPGISENLANTLKQKEILLERIKQYKEISKRPIKKSTTTSRRESVSESKKQDVSDAAQLHNTIKEKDNLLSVMQVKMRTMETTILDLQEKITEKDQIIEAKNKATTLIADSSSKKEKDSLALLEDTRLQMTKMQENFISMESEWKQEKDTLLKEIESQHQKVTSLEEANSILETSRFEVSLAQSKLADELELKLKEIELKDQEILQLKAQLEHYSEPDFIVKEQLQKPEESFEEEKGSQEIAKMVELTNKVKLLEQINCQIRKTNKELENKLAKANIESKPSSLSPHKKGSPVAGRKTTRNTVAKLKSPWSNVSPETSQESDIKSNKTDIVKTELVIQSLNKEILDKEYIISDKEKLIQELQAINAKSEELIIELQQTSKLMQHIDTVDVAVITDDIGLKDDSSHDVFSANDQEQVEFICSGDTVDLEKKLYEAQQQVVSLNAEIEAANKNMIKVKSNHKLKLKQMQKTIDNLSKVSDANAEIVRLNEELHQLTQKVAELEEEKGNLQLHLVDYDSGRLTDSEVFKKMVEMENLADTRLNAISLLEAQKFDLAQDLHILQQKYTDVEDQLTDIHQLQSEHVCSEMKSVQLEEQIDVLTASRNEFQLVVENLKLDKEQLNQSINMLHKEKDELNLKLQHYAQENMVLTDKLEKLSAEKVSSAESIEIVESLTAQEKLELEEYNKNMSENNTENRTIANKVSLSYECNENIEKIVEESAELSRRIELFTQERQEVMEKMNKINSENELLHEKISELTIQTETYERDIIQLNIEKQELIILNEELARQIEGLKQARVEIVKENIETPKPALVEDIAIEVSSIEIQPDEKISGDKNVARTKSMKQLTKEILKLKNIIKDREDQIADCQMKILSIEEQHQKQNELIQNSLHMENKLKIVTSENNQLREEIDILKNDKENVEKIQEINESLQNDIHNLQLQYANTIQSRDSRVQELENLLLEYEKQIYNYGNTLQQKDKEMVDYLNQITKLNDVSQKLRSTIEVLEEEKAKDQNGELVKSLNKQISVFQKKITEYEDKIRVLEEEKAQLLSLKNVLESKNTALETELRKCQDALVEKQNILKELQIVQQTHNEEISNMRLQAKERDEEIHEIKLQLRKESIENEKLRNELIEKDVIIEKYIEELNTTKDSLLKLSTNDDKFNEQHLALELKNKELLEKLKKFAVNLKKKSAMYTEIELQLFETRKQLELRTENLDQLKVQVQGLPVLQDKVIYLEGELNRAQSQKVIIEQQSLGLEKLNTENQLLKDNLDKVTNEITILNNMQTIAQDQLRLSHDEIHNLKTQLDVLNNRLVHYEIEQKNYLNFSTKVSTLEADISKKDLHIAELIGKLETQEQQLSQLQYGHNAKIQERELFIESLESEICKYKDRICRLEESISTMEDRRHSLERKADHLGSQLQEKHKAYTEYRSQEDELVNRLAVLMDHDRVLEKQLHEIENDNKELQYKVQHINDENQKLRKSINDLQENCSTLTEKASRTDTTEAILLTCQSQIRDYEANLKRISNENQTLITQNNQAIEELESEFNTQIENAIKDKKVLTEKYEKSCEYITQLESKLQEYNNTIQNLKINHDELFKINENLLEKLATDKVQNTDYTEQYIMEINKLNTDIKTLNQSNLELSEKFKSLETYSLTSKSNFECIISELNSQILEKSNDIEKMNTENNMLKVNNEALLVEMLRKDERIKQLIDEKKPSFEMNIPKTEGMVISSTIEALSDETRGMDMLSLESQIVSENIPSNPDNKITAKKILDATKYQASGQQEEPVIVCKKAYLCYDKDDHGETEGVDPFNSDEGWGLGESEEVSDITPGLSHLNNQILHLQEERNTLKIELEKSNTKLFKVVKKLKELKAQNDMIVNELNLTKKMSQSSFLDTAIEDELRNIIQELEKKISDLDSELYKEKKQNETLKKQNEVFNNANDRLTEMKEKMDNEIELWKFKFKEVNDKLATLQWTEDTKTSSEIKVLSTKQEVNDTYLENELQKLEKENDELQLIVDQLTTQNKELLSAQKISEDEIINFKKQVKDRVNSCENCEGLKISIQDLQNLYAETCASNEVSQNTLLNLETQYNELKHENDKLKIDNELMQKSVTDNIDLLKEIDSLKQQNVHIGENLQVRTEELSSLLLELENTKKKSHEYDDCEEKIKIRDINSSELSEKFKVKEKECFDLKNKLEQANENISQLTTENIELDKIVQDNEEQIKILHSQVQNLNSENDQLLSTVAELRSSISSAVDQRGYEIAELWKQHLAQREIDFQKIEQEIRAQLSAAELKYEQLLDSVQSSSQEETNKLVMMEQLSSIHSKLQDKENHLHNLQDKYAEAINQLDMLRSEMEDEKLVHENKLLSQQEEYEKQIEEILIKYKKENEEFEEKFLNVSNELSSSKAKVDDLNHQLDEMQTTLTEQTTTIVTLTNEIRVKESEIYQKTHDYTITLSQRNEEFEIVRKQLVEFEKKLEDLTYEKESELAVLRLKLHENKEKYNIMQNEHDVEKTNLAEALNAKILECTNLNKQIADLNNQLEEHSNRAVELQSALENQELDLVTLKDEIVYLQNELRSSNSKIEKHVTFASDTKPGAETETEEGTLNRELLDAIPRAELDLALYMLHQRDVRCEELTMELTQLLEERDTLQLRLSDSLRSYEEIKSKYNFGGLDLSTSSQDTISELPSFSVEREHQLIDVHRPQTSRSSSLSETDGDKPKLQAKLSELRSVRHSRDVRLRHDSEQRQLDMRLMHRDVANLPPEAKQQLAQAHHTLSRDSQSTPTVLLNWLRGKSTPKVLDM